MRTGGDRDVPPPRDRTVRPGTEPQRLARLRAHGWDLRCARHRRIAPRWSHLESGSHPDSMLPAGATRQAGPAARPRPRRCPATGSRLVQPDVQQPAAERLDVVKLEALRELAQPLPISLGPATPGDRLEDHSLPLPADQDFVPSEPECLGQPYRLRPPVPEQLRPRLKV